jgi:hypothetical protein
MNNPEAILKTIDDIRTKRAEQAELINQLEIQAHLVILGVDLEEIECYSPFPPDRVNYLIKMGKFPRSLSGCGVHAIRLKDKTEILIDTTNWRLEKWLT